MPRNDVNPAALGKCRVYSSRDRKPPALREPDRQVVDGGLEDGGFDLAVDRIEDRHALTRRQPAAAWNAVMTAGTRIGVNVSPKIATADRYCMVLSLSRRGRLIKFWRFRRSAIEFDIWVRIRRRAGQENYRSEVRAAISRTENSWLFF